MPGFIGAGPWKWRAGYFGIALLVLILDQITKLWVRMEFAHLDSKTVIPGFFTLWYQRNRGGAFGLLTNLSDGTRSVVFILIPTVMVAVILVWSLRAAVRPMLPQLSLAIILGGAIGNLLDRIRYGFVVDFFHFFVQIGERVFTYPTFNVADAFITVGVGALVVHIFLEERASKTPAAGAS